jgi:hypothetical protein
MMEAGGATEGYKLLFVEKLRRKQLKKLSQRGEKGGGRGEDGLKGGGVPARPRRNGHGRSFALGGRDSLGRRSGPLPLLLHHLSTLHPQLRGGRVGCSGGNLAPCAAPGPLGRLLRGGGLRGPGEGVDGLFAGVV